MVRTYWQVNQTIGYRREQKYDERPRIENEEK